MASFAPLVEVKKLRVERDQIILNQIDWTVCPGEHWVILGANGSGKTSLINVLAGYLMPTSGTIKVLGQEYGKTNWQLIRQKIGLISTSLAQHIQPEETALSIVASGKKAIINLWKNPSPKEIKQARQILRQMDCFHLAQRSWALLSQGERQRILIGRALMANFALLFLDEPCAGLDPVARENFLQFIEKLTHPKSAPALVLITHHVEEIAPGFTHCLLLKKGRVLAKGTKSKTLSSKILSLCFQIPIKLSYKKNRYQLQLKR